MGHQRETIGGSRGGPVAHRDRLSHSQNLVMDRSGGMSDLLDAVPEHRSLDDIGKVI